MNRNLFYISIVTCSLLASCTHDDIADSSLPEGKYPLTLTAGNLLSAGGTRATTDGNWDGAAAVAVQVGGVVRQYDVTASTGASSASLTSDTSFYWHYNDESIDITAWYPYSTECPSQWTVKANQRLQGNYEASDFLKGELRLSFADRNDPSKNAITFSHQTAKIVVNIVDGKGALPTDIDGASLLNVEGVEGEASSVFLRKSDKLQYSGLINAQTISAGKPFIQLEGTGSGFDDYYFNYTPTTDKTLEAGKTYTYNITLTTNGIEVTEATSSEWLAYGMENVTSVVRLAKYTASQLKIGDYIYTDGTTSDGGLRALYSNGTYQQESVMPVSGKTVSGIVFWTASDCDPANAGDADLNADKVRVAEYPSCNHGLAISLISITGGFQSSPTSMAEFQTSSSFNPTHKDLFSSVEVSTGIGKILGYQNTVVLNEFLCSSVATPINALASLGEIMIANPAPSSSTGWYIPSLREMHILYFTDDSYPNIKRDNEIYDIVRDSMKNAGSSWLGHESDWTSSEYNKYHNYVAHPTSYSYYFKTDAWIKLRAVCAF